MSIRFLLQCVCGTIKGHRSSSHHARCEVNGWQRVVSSLSCQSRVSPAALPAAKSAILPASAFGARRPFGPLGQTPRDPQHHSIPGAITDEISFPASIVIRHFPGPGHTPFPESPSAAFIHYRESCPDTHSLSPPPSALLLTRTKHTTRSLCLLHGPLHSVYSLTAMVLEA